MGLGLIPLIRDICGHYKLDPLTEFSSSSRSTVVKDILPWKISQMITKSIPINTRIVINNTIKWGIRCEYDGKSVETEIIT